jgi:Na+-driven multidrug efflux pump
MGLCPTLYTTLRTFFLGQLPGDWSYSIAGQLSWVNLLYEVINEAIVLPLYFFMGQTVLDKEEYTNRIRSGLLVSLGIYTVCSVLVMIFVDPLLRFMAVSPDILSESASYIRIECVANIFGILYSFICVALITIGKDKLVYAITAAKLVLSLLLDTLLISTLPVLLNCGVNGIDISNIISNLILFLISAFLICKCGYPLFKKEKISFTWMKDFIKIGSISGLESFVRNIAYMLMVSRMVNMVGEQGTYWVANNFIWGWMLLPITQLGELIKQETAKDKNAVKSNTHGYFTITTITCLIWVITIPLYKPFMRNILGYSDVDKLFKLVMVLFVFYVMYAFQNVFDATFYGRGKTNYMLFESIVTNSIYYGTFFIFYLCGVWKPTLIGIALMFGCGNAFDTVVSYIAYRHFLKKGKYTDTC